MFALGLSERTSLRAGVDPDKLWDAGLFAVIAAFVFSRALLVAGNLRTFMVVPLLLLTVPSLTASGLLLTAVATVLWLRWKRVPVRAAIDAWAPCGTLVWAFLALGHFAEGSDPGLPTSLALGIRMPGESTPLHPVALYAAAVAAALTWWLYRRLQQTRRAGETAGLGLAAVGVAQFLLSFMRQPGIEAAAGLDLLQWVAVAMMVAGAVLVAAAT